MKYEKWLYEWLSNYIKPTAKGKTYTRYSEIVEKHLIPRLGQYELEEISPLLLQTQVADFLECGNLKTGGGLSTGSVNLIITVIQDSLQTAYRLGYVEHYVGDKIMRPKIQEQPVTCFSLLKQKRIEQYALNDKRPKMVGIILCLYTGVRIGELLALEWSDIDFAKGEICVCKTCYDSKNSSGYYRAVNAPKTSSSNRIIPLPKRIIPLLREIKKNSRSQYVIASGDKGISIRSYQRSYELMIKKLDIPYRSFHSLRHTFATRALECGMDVKTLSEILGHKSPTVTLNRYVHSLMEHKRAMMDKVGKLL